MDCSNGEGLENSWSGPARLFDMSETNSSWKGENMKLGTDLDRELQHSCSLLRFRNDSLL
jgi:hypothetical protein